MEGSLPTAMGEYIKVNRWDIYHNQTDFHQSQTDFYPTTGVPSGAPSGAPTGAPTGAGNVGLSLHDLLGAPGFPSLTPTLTSMGRPVYRNRDRFLLLYHEIESRKGASVSGWTIVINDNILFASRGDSSTYKPVEATRSSSNTAICPDQLGSTTKWEWFETRGAASITIVQGGAH
jgi:hypothetical protein